MYITTGFASANVPSNPLIRSNGRSQRVDLVCGNRAVPVANAMHRIELRSNDRLRLAPCQPHDKGVVILPLTKGCF